MGEELPGQAQGRPQALTSERQSGVVTLLFTDVVGSTALKERLGDRTGVELLEQHHALVRQTIAQFKGAEEINVAGDSFLVLFPVPSEAVKCALVLQRRLGQLNQGRAVPVMDRMGLHLGEVLVQETGSGQRNVHGIQVDTCSRVMSLAHGGQVLMTRPVFDNARASLKGEEIEGISELAWLNHGRFELRGMAEPFEICEVLVGGSTHPPAPTTSEKARRVEAAEGEAVLGWRPAVGNLVPNTQWVLEGKLGEGGFGEVWLGRHQLMKERRVFKFCFRADRVRSLKREMTLFRLIKERMGDHPNIVAVREVYFEQPPFYVEEDYFGGTDLLSWCAAQGGADKVPLQTKLEIVAQVADALQAAHDAGVIHRDVKPGNILVSGHPSGPSTLNPQPSAKLTDFGIGQVVSEEVLVGVTRAGFTQTMLSSSSSQTGTQLYIAPEVLAGRPASTRSDIYSLGVVLYQSLVGDFRQAVTIDWTKRVTNTLLREDLEHCLAGEPTDRFSGAGQLAKSLRQLEERQDTLERQQSELAARERAAYRRGVARTAGLAFVAMGVFAALALVALYQSSVAQSRARILRRLSYAADMRVAQRAIEEHDRVRATAVLDRYWPSGNAEDLRGFEWRYIWSATRGDQITTLRGHEGIIAAARFSPDGELMATAGFDCQVLVRDAATKEVKRRLPVAVSELVWLKLLSFSPDGRFLVIQGERGLGLWDPHRGRLEREFENAWCPLAFSLDGRRLVAWSRGGVGSNSRIRVWETADWTSWELDSGSASKRFPFMPLALSHDGRWLAAGCRYLGVSVWDLDARTQPIRLGGDVLSVLFAGEGNLLYSGDFEGNICLWGVNKREPLHTASLHKGFVFDLRLSPDGRTLASAGADQTIRLWNATNLAPLATLTGHLNEVWTVDYSPDGRTLLSAGKDGTARLWAAQGKRDTVPVIPAPWTFTFSQGGREIVVPGRNSLLTIWNTNGFRKTEVSPQALAAKVSSSRWSEDMHTVRFIADDGSTVLWDVETNGLIARLQLAEPLESFVVSGNRRLLYGGGQREGLSWLRDLGAGGVKATFTDYSTEAWGAAFSQDSRLLVRATTNHLVKVWNVTEGQEVCVLRGHGWKVSAVAFSPDDKLLATGCWSGELRVWDTTSWQLAMAPIVAHYAAVNAIDFHPAERTVLTSSGGEFTTRLWSLDTGQEMLRFPDAPVARFSMDGNTLALYRQSKRAIHLHAVPSRAEIDALRKAQRMVP